MTGMFKDFASGIARTWNWSAGLKGACTALALLVVLRYAGEGVGVTVGDRILEEGFGLWLVLAQIAALGVGGTLAGYLLKTNRVLDGALAGAFTWVVATVLITALLGGIGPQTLRSAVWSTFFGTLLSLGSAVVGGILGAQLHPHARVWVDEQP